MVGRRGRRCLSLPLARRALLRPPRSRPSLLLCSSPRAALELTRRRLLSHLAARRTSSTSPASGTAAAWTSLHPTAAQAAATAAAGRAGDLCLAVA
jgi:hypothetical protein